MIDTNKIRRALGHRRKRTRAPLEEVVADHARRDSRVDVVAAAVVDEHLRIVGKHDLLHDVQLVARRGTPEGPVQCTSAPRGFDVGGEIASFLHSRKMEEPTKRTPRLRGGFSLSMRTNRRISPSYHSPLVTYSIIAARDLGVVVDAPPLLPRARGEGTRDRHGAADALGRPEASPLVAAAPPTAAAAGMRWKVGTRPIRL